MAENLDSLSKEELIEYVEKLQKVLEDDENEIARLTQENERSGRKRSVGKDTDPYSSEISVYIAEIDNLKARQEQDSIELAKLQDQLSDTKARYATLLTDKVDLENRVKTQSKRIDELEKELLGVSNLSKSTAQQNQEFSKLKSDTNKETIRLLQEIETLQEKNQENLITIKELEEYKALLEGTIDKLANEKDDLASHKDNADLTTQELLARIAELEDIVEQNQEKLNITQDHHTELHNEKETLKKESQIKINQLQAQLEAKHKETEDLKLHLSTLKSGTGAGASTTKASSNEDEIDNTKLMEELQRELELTIEERDKLAERIISTEDSIEKIVNERVATEREKIRLLEKNVENLRIKLGSDSSKTREFDTEKAQLSSEIDELRNWKAVYEAGHGMQELARNQKKLKDQNRRLEIAIDQMNSKLGALMDANGIISQAFDRLKAETGKDPSFMYPEYILHEDMLSDKAKLSAQVKELDNQVDVLEKENIRLRKLLKNQAGSMGEKNLESLKDDNLDLLLENRTADLLRENKRLKDDIKLLTLQLQHYEKDNIPSQPIQLSQPMESNTKEITSLREDIQKLFNYLRVKSFSADSVDKNVNESISSILLAHNEALMKEIKNLQKLQGSSKEISESRMETKPISSLQTSSSGGVLTSASTSVSASASHPTKVPSTTIIESSRLSSEKKNMSTESYKFPPTEKHSNQVSMIPGTAAAAGGGGGNISATIKDIHPILPSTSYGSILLNKNLAQLSLPPEDWAQDVRDLNVQLIECLEQLFDREQEIEEQKNIIASFEDHLISVKQQTTVLYHDFVKKSSTWEKREKEYKEDSLKLRQENEDLKLKLKRINELLEVKREGKIEILESKLYDLTKKLSIHEVNENILSRKYISQSEQLIVEQEIRRKLEMDIAEMESALKKRILYLEQYKATAGSRLAFLQTKLDVSVPQEDYLSLQTELEFLREEHLNGLRREVDARVIALTGQENIQELRSLRLQSIQLEVQLKQYQDMSNKLSSQLDHQKELSNRAISAIKSPSSDVSSLISEMATYRGEAARLEVELAASNKRVELLHHQLQQSALECDQEKARVHDLEDKLTEAMSLESLAKKELLDMKTKYEYGLTRDVAERMKSNLEKVSKELEESKRECNRLKEIADISSKQAQTLAFYKQDQLQNLKELQEYCSKLESRGEDDILIGKLQRQLMSTKTSYKVFVRKYQLLQGNMRQRELAIRMLEARLDQREDTVLKLQETHRLETNALKKALRSIQNTFDDGDGNDDNDGNGDNKSNHSSSTVSFHPGSSSISKLKLTSKGKRLKGLKHSSLTLGFKLKDLSKKVTHYSHLAEKAVIRKVEKEQEYKKLRSKLDEVTVEKEILEERCADLDTINRDKTKSGVISARLVALSEEIRVSKLLNLQQRRQIQILRQEKKHLESVITAIESDVENLEEINVRSQIKNYLLPTLSENEGEFFVGDSLSGKSSSAVDKFYQKVSFTRKDDNNMIVLDERGDVEGVEGRIGDDNINIKTSVEENSILDSDEMISKIQVLSNQLKDSNRTASAYKLQIDNLMSKIDQMEAAMKENEEHLTYYKRTMSAEGLPLLSGSKSKTNYYDRDKGGRISIDEQEKLQEAASATIGSLRSLIEEKNRTIEKLREKIEELQQDRSRKKSRADQNAETLLERLNEDESHDRGDYRKHSSGSDTNTRSKYLSDDETKILNQKLIDQLEQAEQLILEKSQTINQLEQKLLTQINQKERAEVRCGESIKEMETMKTDMVRLAQQLQLSEERFKAILPKSSSIHTSGIHNTSGNTLTTAVLASSSPEIIEKKIKDLTKALKTKEDKIKGYREIIVKLKEEFIKSEEEKAIVLLGVKGGKDYKPSRQSDELIITSNEMRQLRDQISTLRAGLQQAKEDLEKARISREKTNKARQAALEDVNRLENQISALQSEASLLEEAKEKFKKDLEDSRRKEMRLRDKIKDMMDSNAYVSGNTEMKSLVTRVESLDREVVMLRAQNAALRGGENLPTGSSDPLDRQTGKEKSESTIPGTGRILGTASGMDIDSKDDIRQQLHTKWENEKKLQKRVTVLEKRLQEKMDENEELQSQLIRAREAVQTAVHAKTELSKNLSKVTKSTKEMKDTKPLMPDEFMEQAQSRIFELEEENSTLKRRIEVECANEIASLRQQLQSARTQVEELETEVAEYQQKKKQRGDSYSIRDSEDRFIREERLKDEISFLKRQRLEMEAALLDRDSRAMEHKFDIAAQDQEISRLRRRLREVETSLQNIRDYGSDIPSTRPVSGGISSGAGGRESDVQKGKREKELEMTIETMRKVIDKLRTDTDRMRKISPGPTLTATGVGEDRKGGERTLNVDKKKIEKLEEEMKDLRAKVKNYDDIMLKLTQRQQQIASLRKQLKIKEDEVLSNRDKLEEVTKEKDIITKKLISSESRIQQLELSLQQTSSKVLSSGLQPRDEIESLRYQINELKSRLATREADIANLQSSSSFSGQGQGQNPVNNAYLAKLEEENKKLKNELAAFDMEFFDEIENLKYEHAEAIRKLRVYKRTYGEIS